MENLIIPMGHIILAGGFLLLGIIFKKYPPKTINSWYGFRTAFSMKNQRTWDVANRYNGQVMLIAGVINIIFDIIIYFSVRGMRSIQIEGIFLAVISLISIIVVEIYLRKKFDKNGNPRPLQ